MLPLMISPEAAQTSQPMAAVSLLSLAAARANQELVKRWKPQEGLAPARLVPDSRCGSLDNKGHLCLLSSSLILTAH